MLKFGNAATRSVVYIDRTRVLPSVTFRRARRTPGDGFFKFNFVVEISKRWEIPYVRSSSRYTCETDFFKFTGDKFIRR